MAAQKEARRAEGRPMMWALRNLLRAASPLLRRRCVPVPFPSKLTWSCNTYSSSPFLLAISDVCAYFGSLAARDGAEAVASTVSSRLLPVGLRLAISTSNGRSIRSKVEKRIGKETGCRQLDLHCAVKVRKKLRNDDEKLI